MPPPTVRRAPYRDFLQPTLQRRFASTALLVLALAYLESLLMTHWNSWLWSWFPLGIAGFRALAIFLCGFFIVVLRIAHPHVGVRTTKSPFETFKTSALTLNTAETLFTYSASALLFSQIYQPVVAEKSHLAWVTFRSGDRARLNERALFYTVGLILLGIIEGTRHLLHDYDRITLGQVKDGGEAQTKPEDPFEKLLKDAPRLLGRSAKRAFVASVFCYFIGYHFLRWTAYGWAMSYFRLFYNLPKSNIPPGSAPWNFWMLWKTWWAGTLLCLLWSFGNAALTHRLGQEPMKNGRPLTSESKDPNGSLLNGLKSKKDRISAFAMWELALIARDSEVRRTAIFEDIDRADGPMWSQIYVLSINTIKAIDQRIDSYGKPPPPPAFPQEPVVTAQPPALVAEAPAETNVWAKPDPPKDFLGNLGQKTQTWARAPGKRPVETVVPLAQNYMTEIKDRLLSKQHQEHLSRDSLAGFARRVALHVIKRHHVGPLFRETYSRRLTNAILGSPYGETSVYANASFALSQLALHSLQEDKYGIVSRDVPAIIRSYTTVIKKLEVFADNMPIHWTDIYGIRKCEVVDELLDSFREGLIKVVDAFEPYREDLRISRADMRLAKEAATKPVKEESPGFEINPMAILQFVLDLLS